MRISEIATLDLENLCRESPKIKVKTNENETKTLLLSNELDDLPLPSFRAGSDISTLRNGAFSKLFNATENWSSPRARMDLKRPNLRGILVGRRLF